MPHVGSGAIESGGLQCSHVIKGGLDRKRLGNTGIDDFSPSGGSVGQCRLKPADTGLMGSEFSPILSQQNRILVCIVSIFRLF